MSKEKFVIQTLIDLVDISIFRLNVKIHNLDNDTIFKL